MRYVVTLLILISTPLDCSYLYAASKAERSSLIGLPGVSVVIDNVALDMKAQGLSQEGIRTAVEQVLRSSGIRILTDEESLDVPSSPSLHVIIASLKNPTLPQYSYCLTVELRQYVSLSTTKNLVATTWSTGYLGFVGTNRLSDITRRSEELTQQFADDFLAVHPR